MMTFTLEKQMTLKLKNKFNMIKPQVQTANHFQPLYNLIITV